MRNRFNDALVIQNGACNPSGILHSIQDAIKDMREQPNHKGTDEITSDPALRLMVHQLAYLFNIWEIEAGIGVYGNLIKECQERS